MSLYSEIVEQPERIKHLLASQKKTMEKIVDVFQIILNGFGGSRLFHTK
jgi:hypothetical protein